MYCFLDPSDFTRSSDFFLPTAIGRVLPGNTMVLRKGSKGRVFFKRDSSMSVLPSIKSVPINEMISPSGSLLLNLSLLNGFILSFSLSSKQKQGYICSVTVCNDSSKSVPKRRSHFLNCFCIRLVF